MRIDWKRLSGFIVFAAASGAAVAAELTATEPLAGGVRTRATDASVGRADEAARVGNDRYAFADRSD